MSGHSKWANIKHQKGAADAKRAAIFTKLAKNVTIAAREGGGDPTFNFKLRSAIDMARGANMPKDNIDRAVKRGTGEIEGAQIEEVLYEGRAPGGAVAVMVRTLTDNRNRSAANIKHLFSKHEGTMGGAGSVQWLFEKKGVVRVAVESMPAEDTQLAVIDAGADDLRMEEGALTVQCPVEALQQVVAAVEAQGMRSEYSGIEWVPKERIEAPENAEAVEEFLDALDDDEDVDAVFTNMG